MTLSWRTQNADSITINNGVGSVTPVAAGSVIVRPTQTTTYVATVTGGDQSVNCQTTVTVRSTPPPAAKCIFLTATPTTITSGQSVTLRWKTENATSITINNGVGSVTPVAQGSVVVNPTQSTTYVATVTGGGQSVNCQASVVVVPPEPDAPRCIYLTATPTTIDDAGDPVVLRWKTENATSVTINNGVGSVTPVAEGSVTVHPNDDTTYVATVANAKGSVNCQVHVELDEDEDEPEDARCIYLRASDTSIEEGDEITLSWKTENADEIRINNGIGEVHPTDEGDIEVSPDEDTTYIATVYPRDNDGDTDTCEVHVDVDEDDGGGGGGGRKKPKVLVDVLPYPPEEQLSFVYLSEVPYTGLDLGPMGTALYWLMLIGWSAAAAYLVLFNGLPFIARKMNKLGSDVGHGINSDAHGHDAHAAPAHHVAQSAHAAPAAHGHAAPAPSFRGYTSTEGFRSFAQGKELTIDDVVKALSRETGHTEPVQVPHTEEVEIPHTEPIAHAAPAPVAAPAPRAPEMEVHHDVPAFISALLAGDRDTVFSMLREVNRTGGDSETFVTHAVCALDDAYRARLEGTPCHPDVKRVTDGVADSFLERVIASLATAVDSSYSTGVTGAKLALTRALAVVNG